jgi:hypothetical protein
MPPRYTFKPHSDCLSIHILPGKHTLHSIKVQMDYTYQSSVQSLIPKECESRCDGWHCTATQSGYGYRNQCNDNRLMPPRCTTKGLGSLVSFGFSDDGDGSSEGSSPVVVGRGASVVIVGISAGFCVTQKKVPAMGASNLTLRMKRARSKCLRWDSFPLSLLRPSNSGVLSYSKNT